MSARKYFGTDGIRGRVGQGVISADFVLRLGNALGRVLTAGLSKRPRPNWPLPRAILPGKGRPDRVTPSWRKRVFTASFP